MNISIIGAGNMAWHLARTFEKAGIGVVEIYARDIRKALALSETLYSAVAVNSLNFSSSNSRIFFICVSDDSIAPVASQLLVPDGSLVVHTSGAKPLKELSGVEDAYNERTVSTGVFYPLQTFTKDVAQDLSDVPVLIESENAGSLSILEQIAAKVSHSVARVSTHERLVYHASAVFSCNFVNHLWAISKEILESEKLDFEMLKPLIAETTRKMLRTEHPAQVQTGPAVRNDVKTINAHLNYLRDDDDLIKVYTTLTESISDWHRID